MITEDELNDMLEINFAEQKFYWEIMSVPDRTIVKVYNGVQRDRKLVYFKKEELTLLGKQLNHFFNRFSTRYGYSYSVLIVDPVIDEEIELEEITGEAIPVVVIKDCFFSQNELETIFRGFGFIRKSITFTSNDYYRERVTIDFRRLLEDVEIENRLAKYRSKYTFTFTAVRAAKKLVKTQITIQL